jgi:Xaa-Pro aminopeptidase
MTAIQPVTWRGYSEAERDRRWGTVRAGAAAAGLDCILVPLALDNLSFRPVLDEPSATGANGRYLSQLDGAVVVLPTSDAVAPIVITERPSRNSWLAETRTSGRGWLEPTLQALQETGMERATIGVVGLRSGAYTHANAPDGVVVHSAFADLLARLPEATFRDATDVVGRARFLKSDEEIQSLRRASEIATAGIETLVEVARPGVAEATVYARMMGRLLSAGSAYVPLALSAGPADQPRYQHVNPQLGRTLEAGWIVEADVRAIWGGLFACETQSIGLGKMPDAYTDLAALQQEVFTSLLAAMTTGRVVSDVVQDIRTRGVRDGAHTDILLRGCGYGDDGPRLDSSRPGRAGDARLEPGSTWTCRLTTARGDDATRLRWGTTLAVTDAGCLALAGRKPSLVAS